MLLIGLEAPELLLYLLTAFLVSFTLHETAHAFVAYLLGDPTAKEQGRLTLNPLAHLSPIGTLLLLTVGLGWGKPVPVDPFRFKRLSPKVGMGLVALAGPVVNFALALLVAVPLHLKLLPYTPMRVGPLLVSWGEFAAWFFWLNMTLAVFNLIPFGPLDGARILAAFLPDWWFFFSARIELYLLGLFFALILIDRFTGTGLLARLIAPIGCQSWWWLVGYTPPFPFCGML
ncbi:hypothetical protein ARMA_2495 [Ardenticatena maritima]|uniref:Peptidase M50 domain-containing protein n=1 Tax=Ardenticatena maritima TaxID=872965 RepID=A0A0M8KAH9_9CHLR|nr:site-2 protease family protein [Ardenticatena maritima]KPL86407.1 hypothetical protein SE16_13945 [Ardenticatena maritima]GAP64072.1 hypothetical protein ARMA_2495 [Ardenticatena maritima]